VSPLWRDEIGIYLGRHRVCLIRLKRGLRPAVSRREDVSGGAAGPGWEGSMELLERELANGSWSNARARIVVADYWVRYSTVPWSDGLSSAAERTAHARQLMTEVFGDSMSGWSISMSDAKPGASCLAAAIPSALLDALKDATLRYSLKMISLQPQLIAAYISWGHVLPVNERRWFVTLEHGSLAAMRIGADGIDRVHSVRIGADWARELKRLHTFGRLASVTASDGRIYVDLPMPLWALRPNLGDALQWLDEAQPPMTTAHQLESLRRSVA
jgi:hypothetical protein